MLHAGREVNVVERLQLTEDEAKLVFEQEIYAKGRVVKRKEEFSIAPTGESSAKEHVLASLPPPLRVESIGEWAAADIAKFAYFFSIVAGVFFLESFNPDFWRPGNRIA